MDKSVHTPEYALLRESLRSVRDRAGLSQRDLAARLNVAPSWVAKVETGERRLDVVEFYWLMAACGGDAASTFASLCVEFANRRKPPRGRVASQK